jgi:hypothetical protein
MCIHLSVWWLCAAYCTEKPASYAWQHRPCMPKHSMQGCLLCSTPSVLIARLSFSLLSLPTFSTAGGVPLVIDLCMCANWV